jgi:hypothetical protein
MSAPDPKKVAKKFMAQRGTDYMELFLAPYPRGLTRRLPNELDVVWWRAGEMMEGDIHGFIAADDPEAINDDAAYKVGANVRVRADKVYLR